MQKKNGISQKKKFMDLILEALKFELLLIINQITHATKSNICISRSEYVPRFLTILGYIRLQQLVL